MLAFPFGEREGSARSAGSPSLSQARLVKLYLVPKLRIELSTLASSGRRSTNELLRHIVWYRKEDSNLHTLAGTGT